MMSASVSSRDQNRLLPLEIAVAFCLGLALCWPMVQKVWETGLFVDSDDAMRMVQVRDWMAGQPWFDLAPHRLGFPGASVATHWTRVIDVPIAALVWMFSRLLGADFGERAARIAFPVLLQVGLLTAVGLCARSLAGRAATAPALLICALSGSVFIRFEPGRIDHHAAQIVILLLALLASLRSLDSTRPGRAGFTSGALMALSLSISLENLPMIGGLSAMFVLAWVLNGQKRADSLRGFGLGLAGCLVPLLVITTPPERLLTPVCDASSIVHATLAVAGCCICIALAAAGRSTILLATWRGRLLATCAGGAALLALLMLLFPACAGDPYSAVDPLVHRLWLDHVREARPLLRAFEEDSAIVGPMTISAIFGIGSMAAAVVFERGGARLRWLFALAVALCALVTTIWKVSAISPLVSVAGLGAVWPLLRIQPFLMRRGAGLARVLTLACALPFSTVALAVAAPGGAAGSPNLSSACTDPRSFGPLAALPRGLIFSPINYGAHILAWTRHSVLAGPYHRNNAGNRAVLEGFLAEPGRAQDMVVASGAEYLAFCQGDLEPLAERDPGSLAARLLSGEAPGWLHRLTPLASRERPYTIFEVQR